MFVNDEIIHWHQNLKKHFLQNISMFSFNYLIKQNFIKIFLGSFDSFRINIRYSCRVTSGLEIVNKG